MALYFCTGAFNKENNFKHYALNVPLYTHFTSPIRRYADVIVHRLLVASLSGCHFSRTDVPFCFTPTFISYLLVYPQNAALASA